LTVAWTPLLPALLLAAAGAPAEHRVPVSDFHLIASESGPVNYYRVIAPGDGGDMRDGFIHATYQPPWKTAVMGVDLKFDPRGHKLRWKWRALKLPVGANECVDGKADSPAMVYLAWRDGLKWHVLKLVWSTSVPKGTRCNHRENLFRSEETVVLESGAAKLNQWVDEEIDLDAEHRRAFSHGDARAKVPPFKGLALFTDGDQSHSLAAADYSDFVLFKP
jgi:hypothetical protein